MRCLLTLLPVPSPRSATCCNNCRSMGSILVDFEGQAEMCCGENGDGWTLLEMGKLRRRSVRLGVQGCQPCHITVCDVCRARGALISLALSGWFKGTDPNTQHRSLLRIPFLSLVHHVSLKYWFFLYKPLPPPPTPTHGPSASAALLLRLLPIALDKPREAVPGPPWGVPRREYSGEAL